MLPYLTHHKVTANVRPLGAVGKFEPREFHPMLDANDPPEKRLREAKRFLTQIGWQYRGVKLQGEAA